MADDDASSPALVVELAANVDDATGEALAHAAAALLAAGALDAWLTPILMKKGRPGTIVSALTREADADRLSRELIRQTGSFGVRRRAWDRLVVEREFREVDTAHGRVRVKLGRLGGQALFARPEADAVAAVAAAAGVPFREAMRAAEAAAAVFLPAGPGA